ncbi:hypothetical protein BKA80DRAFT_71139 [Phyllosticta citrichinensis]
MRTPQGYPGTYLPAYLPTFLPTYLSIACAECMLECMPGMHLRGTRLCHAMRREADGTRAREAKRESRRAKKKKKTADRGFIETCWRVRLARRRARMDEDGVHVS